MMKIQKHMVFFLFCSFLSMSQVFAEDADECPLLEGQYQCVGDAKEFYSDDIVTLQQRIVKKNGRDWTEYTLPAPDSSNPDSGIILADDKIHSLGTREDHGLSLEHSYVAFCLKQILTRNFKARSTTLPMEIERVTKLSLNKKHELIIKDILTQRYNGSSQSVKTSSVCKPANN